MAQLWGGRFTKETDQMVYEFNASIGFDKRLFHEDIEGSVAHVAMLAKQGILTEGERDFRRSVKKLTAGSWKSMRHARTSTALWRRN